MEVIHSEGKLWAPIRTKPKKEKKLAEYCEANRINHYLPLRLSLKRYGRKTVEFHVPMFPSYIFCQLDYDLDKLLIRSHGVFFKVKVDEVLEKQLIEDLNSVKIIEKLSTEKEVLVKPEIKSGTMVRITNGPLKGVTGVIENRKTNILVTVNIEILGQSITVEVDVGDVELDK